MIAWRSDGILPLAITGHPHLMRNKKPVTRYSAEKSIKQTKNPEREGFIGQSSAHSSHRLRTSHTPPLKQGPTPAIR